MVIKKKKKAPKPNELSLVSTQAGWLQAHLLMHHCSATLTHSGSSQKDWLVSDFFGGWSPGYFSSFHHSDSQDDRLRICQLCFPALLRTEVGHLGRLSDSGNPLLWSRTSASHSYGSGLLILCFRCGNPNVRGLFPWVVYNLRLL